MTDQNELTALVHRLCQPHTVAVTDKGRIIGTRTDPALLVALRKAKTGGVSHGSGATASHHTRTTLNVAAVELEQTINRHIRQWVLRTDWRPDTAHWPDPERLLQVWYSRVYADNGHETHLATMRTWVKAIEDLIIDPPRRWSLNVPCPVCKQRWAVLNPAAGDEQRVHSLQVTERDTDDAHTITCRNCGAEWHGLEAAQELHDELHAPEVTA